MKTLTLSLPRRNSNKSFSPLDYSGLPLFFLAAFLPAISHLMNPDHFAVGLWSLTGPLLAGGWLAAVMSGSRVFQGMVGAIITILLLGINWIMMAGTCCATYH